MQQHNRLWETDELAQEEAAIQAVHQVTDRDELVLIAQIAPLPSVRGAALGRLTDPAANPSPEGTGEDANTAATAAERTTDQAAILTRIVNAKEPVSTRLALLEQITDLSIHAEVVKQSKSKAVRVRAFERMTDRTVGARFIAEQIPNCKNGRHNLIFTYTQRREQKRSPGIYWLVTVEKCVLCGKKSEQEGLPHIVF